MAANSVSAPTDKKEQIGLPITAHPGGASSPAFCSGGVIGQNRGFTHQRIVHTLNPSKKECCFGLIDFSLGAQKYKRMTAAHPDHYTKMGLLNQGQKKTNNMAMTCPIPSRYFCGLYPGHFEGKHCPYTPCPPSIGKAGSRLKNSQEKIGRCQKQPYT